jgi:flagellar motor switch protein FliN/FliY
VTDGSLDAERDREIWSGMVRQIAERAVRAASAEQQDETLPVAIEIEDAAWELGSPSAAWELRFGETVLLLAFTDETEASAAEAASQEVREPAEEEWKESEEKGSEPRAVAPNGVDLLLDVELETSLRFGSREMPLNEVLDLGAGDVVELDRHVSDPVDLLVGDKIVARGEVVLINGNFGLRVLEVAEPKQCLESIRCLF